VADGGLTAAEFWELPFEERMRRCGELSEHEAFVARLTDPHLPASPPCNDCKFYLGYAKCEVCPDGISPDHIRAVMADQSTECGNGYKFTPKE